jgi:hypothetical protein
VIVLTSCSVGVTVVCEVTTEVTGSVEASAVVLTVVVVVSVVAEVVVVVVVAVVSKVVVMSSVTVFSTPTILLSAASPRPRLGRPYLWVPCPAGSSDSQPKDVVCDSSQDRVR